jgi:hypothetical protein
MDVLHVLNSVLWVLGNIALAYTSVVLLVFVVAYFIIFDPRATTGGRMIFQFMLSLTGILILVCIGIFIDPSANSSWLVLNPNVEWWRPSVRFLIYGFVAYSITSLVVLLVMRKWFPHKLTKASDYTLVQPRHTSEIPVIIRPLIPPPVTPDGKSVDSDV